MFWGKRKPNELKDSPSLLTLATRLGVERRLNVRVNYPQRVKVCKLPEIFFEDNSLRIQNISVGGCCVLDPQGFLGPSVGHDLELFLLWSTVAETVKARIVSRVDHRRHFQFLDLSANRQIHLLKSMAPGIRGISMNRHAFASDLGPSMQAAELWSSSHCDSVILENDAHRLAQVYLNTEQYIIFREAWPNKTLIGKCSRAEFEQLILFLANIPAPTPGIKELIAVLESQLERGPA